MIVHLNHFFLALCLPSLALAREDSSTWFSRIWRRSNAKDIPPEGYVNPLTDGGSFMTKVEGTWPPDLGEPVNVIISANSDSDVLQEREVRGGMFNYWLSIQFSGECLNQHAGNSQQVDLGDGHGLLNETAVMRFNYGDPQLGSCKESIQGGNHFRYWVQNGPNHNTGAFFLATSYELPIAQGHDIIQDGYNLGRDYLVGNVTHSAIETEKLTNQSTFSGDTSFGGFTYHTEIKYVSGLLQNTSIGVNHNDSVAVPGRKAIDGLVAVLEVKITENPKNSASSWQIPSLLVLTLTALSFACL